MEALKRENFIIFDDLFEKLGLEYEQCHYVFVDNVRIYKHYGMYFLLSDKHFGKKRNSSFVIGRIYICNELQSVKARMCIEAYNGITRYEALREEVTELVFTTVEQLERGVYATGKRFKGTLYVPKEKESKIISANKHKRVKAHGLRRIFND